jgi:hypothetical protein
MKYARLASLALLTLYLLSACGPRPNPDLQIRQAVAQTLAALPEPTRAQLPTPLPPSTPFSLAGLFCEYRFCIGHPEDMAFFDVSAQQNPGAPSAYAQGILAAYTANLFIQVMWQVSPGSTEASFLIELILDERYDAAASSLSAEPAGSIQALYMDISTSASPLLPYGGAGAWTCGDRAFAWKAYTPDVASARNLFDAALARFVCQ